MAVLIAAVGNTGRLAAVSSSVWKYGERDDNRRRRAQSADPACRADPARQAFPAYPALLPILP